MNELDLFSATNDVNDKFISKASMKYCKPIKRVRIYKAAITAATLIMIILIVGKVSNNLSGDNFLKHEATTSIKTWDEMQIYEKYVWLNLDGINYTSTVGECSDEIGQLIGEYIVEGVEYTQSIENTNSKENGSDTSGRFSESENSLVNQYIVSGEPKELYTKHEKGVNVYEISGVNKAFAVAVQFSETGECYAYCNSSYITDSYRQFAEACQIEKYLKINHIYLYGDDGKRYVSKSDIPAKILFDNLLSEDNIPMFMTENFPDEFIHGTVKNSESAGGGTKPYNLNPKEVSSKIGEFCKDKEYGKVIADISVDYSLFEDKNISITVYSGGFVSTNIGMTGKCFYVSKETVESFILELRDSLNFYEKGDDE